MKNSKFNKLLNDYIGGTITDTDKSIFIDHINKNPDRKREFEETKQLVEQLNILPKNIAPDSDLWDNIENNINENKVEFKQVADNYYSFDKTPPITTQGKDDSKSSSFPAQYWITGLIAATILVALIIFIPKILNLDKETATINDVGNYWMVSSLEGSPKVQEKDIIKIDTLNIGEWLITDDSSRALLSVANIGEIIVDPRSKLKIVKSDSSGHRIMLDYGTINANINAEPRLFVVDTKSVEVVDLGCSYTFSSDKNGNGLLYVKSGMVALESKNRKSLVAAGSFCITKEGIGPGTPYSKNSSPEFRKALLDLDFKGASDEAVINVLRNAKRTDVVSLLQILPRVRENNKAMVVAKIAKYVPAPRKIYADSIPQLDMKDLNEWIEKLNKEINIELKEELKNLNKEIDKMIREDIIIEFDNEVFTKEFQEELKKEMKEVEKELEEARIEIEINNEELQEELKRVQKEIEEMNIEIELDREELNRELKKAREEIEKSIEEIKDMDFEIEFDNELIQKEIEKAMEEIEDMDLEIELDKEELNRELEKAREEIERANEELKNLNQEEIQEEIEEEMEKIKEELERVNEELKEEMEKQKEELEKQKEELEEQKEELEEELEKEESEETSE